MKNASVFLAIFFIFGIFPMAFHSAESQAEEPLAVDDQTKTIEELMQVTGLKEQIALAPEFMAAGAMESMDNVNPQQAQDMQRIIKESYNGEKLSQGIEAHLKKNFDAKRYSLIIQQMQKPLAKKMVQMEIEAGRAESVKERKAFEEELSRHPPDPERVALILRLLQATQTDQLTLKIQTETSLQINKAIYANQPGGSMAFPSDEEFRKNYQAESQVRMREKTLISMLFDYRQATNEELKQYAAIDETEEARWFNQVVNDALVEVMTEAAKEYGLRLADLLYPRTPPAPASSTSPIL